MPTPIEQPMPSMPSMDEIRVRTAQFRETFEKKRRTYESPATDKQIDYITRLLRERKVPKTLAEQVVRDINVLTDGDCRKIIPDLEGYPYRTTLKKAWQDLGYSITQANSSTASFTDNYSITTGTGQTIRIS